ncbi:hypothetical protein Tco_0111788 [Tanacetum coccineum]
MSPPSLPFPNRLLRDPSSDVCLSRLNRCLLDTTIVRVSEEMCESYIRRAGSDDGMDTGRIDETDGLSLMSVVVQAAVYSAETTVFEELRAAVFFGVFSGLKLPLAFEFKQHGKISSGSVGFVVLGR